MEGEQHHYELRSRSRSRSHTPLVTNQSPMNESMETADHHYDLRSRSRERSHTPGEVTSSRRSGTRSLPSSAAKQRERSMETITEKKEESKPEPATNDQTRRSESSTSSTISRKVERRSERQRVKRQIFSNGQTETIEDSSETKTTEDKRKSVTPRRTITSDYSSEEGEKEDPPSRPGSAYEIYKQAGDWWNVFPKTDYTYSQKSQFRYEIAPGVLAMPNMSRPSIHSDGNSTSGSVNSLSQQNLSQYSRETRESCGDSLDGRDARETIEQNRLNEMSACRRLARASKTEAAIIYKKTHIEQYKCHREIIYGDSRRYGYGGSSQVDSDTELDEAVSLRYGSHEKKWRVRKWLETFGSTIAMWFYSGLEFVNVRVLRRRTVSASHDYHRYRESSWQKSWALINRAMQYLYMLLMRIFFLDTWLLSRASSARSQIKGRRSKVLWLILLPPLLLAGFWLLWWVRDSIPNFSIADYSLMKWKVFERHGGFETLEKNSQQSQVNGKAAQIDEERFKNFLEALASRVEKLEAAEMGKAERMEHINKAMDDLQNNNITAWERYSEKIHNIEKIIDEKSLQRSNEINAVKLEFQGLRQMYANLKSCCDKNVGLASGEEMEQQVERAVAGYFGAGISKQELNRIVETLSTASDDKKSDKIVNDDEALVKNGDNICTGTTSLSDDDMRRIVNEVLKVYDADKTGRVDYALESAGGQVISTRCTQRYNVNTRAYKLLGFTLFYESNNPRTVIQGNSLQPGVCWAFQDFPGRLVIKLRGPVRITGFTVEHVPRSILPNSEMRSAPRKFNVLGLRDENDPEPVSFGDYEFQDSDENLQYFPVQNTEITTSYEYVELIIHSNHGQLEYTCLYRFRVHGIPV